MDCSWDISNFISQSDSLPDELTKKLRSGTNHEFLGSLAETALIPKFTASIFVHFEILSLEICARWATYDLYITAAAFARVLPVLPHLSDFAQQAFSSRGGEVDLLSGLKDGDDQGSRDYNRFLLLAVFRLLNFDNDKFARFIRPAKLQWFLRHDDLSLRHLAIRVICQYMHASDAVFEDMKSKYLGPEPAFGLYEEQFSIDFEFLSLWEHQRLSTLSKHMCSVRDLRNTHDTQDNSLRRVHATDLSANVTMLPGVLLPRSIESTTPNEAGQIFVSAPTTIANLHEIAKRLNEPQPLLLTGPAGCGKTFLVRHIAKKLNKSASMVTLHLNEQSDAKLLIGIYTTGSQPGSFQWQPGVLTTAVSEGRLVLIEDLDRAPNEVMSTLLPLIERNELSISSRGQKITAAPGFKLIATMRSTVNLRGENSAPLGRLLGRRLWNVLPLEVLKEHELREIIIAQYPRITPFIDQILAVYYELAHWKGMGLESKSQMRDRPISTRELLKWTRRINNILPRAALPDGYGSVPEEIMDSIFLDAVECFSGHLEDGVLRAKYVSIIAEELHIDPQRRQYLVANRSVSLKRAKEGTGMRFRIGRSVWTPTSTSKNVTVNQNMSTFALNGHSLRLLERITVAVERQEPLLLVGETGIGKTAVVQHLSRLTVNKLVAINLSQQSEAGDLLGGFKPVNIRSMAIPLKDEFDSLFERIFSQKKNQDFSEQLSKCLRRSQWKRAVVLWRAALKKLEGALQDDGRASPRTTIIADIEQQQTKRRKIRSQVSPETRSQFEVFSQKLDAFERQLLGPTNAFQFSFIEGKLISAVREGHWVLLDEINLASSDTLECISELLDSGPGAQPSIILAETGNVERIFAHPNFRIFAAMNPANDIGKKDLPLGIRSRFTEIFVDSPDRDFQSLRDISRIYIESLSAGNAEYEFATKVAELFQQIQSVAKEEAFVDGSGQATHFSIRTLTRALTHACLVAPRCNIRRAIYEGFCLCFFTCLDVKCAARLQEIVKSALFVNNTAAKTELKKSLAPPQPEGQFAAIVLSVETIGKSKRKPQEELHWLPKGQLPLETPLEYIITPYVKHNLQNLIRAAFTRKYPVLIQGPTSAGKTSMIEYLAKRSGNKFIRINNHEHTDLQEYLGTYISTPDGNLVFQEGVLVQAVREGHWVVLDELNLAPTDVLEALNRLLDDNRELMIPETQEIVKAHNNFVLFATQNPAGPYGGRKMLSRAFRNRFVELHFDDIPVDELNIILAQRSKLPESWCRLIVEVYKRLSTLRQEERLFEEKSFATLRDLFRWAFRGADSVQELAAQGYMLLAEKVRKEEERQSIKLIIEQTMTRKGVKVQIDDEFLYSPDNCPEMELYNQSLGANILWTKAMSRLFVLVCHAIRNNEAVLLVGETGCGKTTVCQMLAQALGKDLHIVNAHQNTETGDLIGAQRPIRNRSAVDEALMLDLRECLSTLHEGSDYSAHGVDSLLEIFGMVEKDDLESLSAEVRTRISTNRMKRKALFEWSDGSLVQAMRSGAYYLLDEISLAEDSVLERMNSVLDPQRSLLLAEKGSDDSLVKAKEGFQFFATMNPGGDFGKKELSPALRNRFTEIWVPPLSDAEDVLQIVEARLIPEARIYSAGMVGFAKWFSERYTSFKVSTISIRDLLAWIEFINFRPVSLLCSIVHGAALVYIDTLGANPSAFLEITGESIPLERIICIRHLGRYLDHDVSYVFEETPQLETMDSALKIGHFSVKSASLSRPGPNFQFETPTTKLNAMRILRALQLPKPILLEGSPGVGKTSIVTAIANATGRNLTRINLSDQTDLMDLFGSDVPVEHADAGTFSWRDAPFLTAMKRGDWVLLDEMNLASQSILEGLNACLDHRGEAYVAELDQTFTRHPDFRLFAAQNPHHQGGGRKGLPASFVNRFTVVYVDAFQPEDLQMICERVFPSYCQPEQIATLIKFVSELGNKISVQRIFGARGSPWEFNLRDILRWLQLLNSNAGLLPAGTAADFFEMLFAQRFRVESDVQNVRNTFRSIYEQEIEERNYFANISESSAQIGLALFQRQDSHGVKSPIRQFKLKPRLALMESLMLCVQQNWPVILVGSSGAGKSFMLNALASIAGAELEVFSLNADIDATDLVGGFEQVDVSRQIQKFLRDLQHFCCSQFQVILNYPESQFAIVVIKLLDLQSCARVVGEDEKSFLRLQNIFDQYLALVPSDEGSAIRQQFQTLANTSRTIGNAMFEWVDGTLVKAIESGRWLVLDNANLCSSSVLDRINSLLEPDGSLIINEHCLEDGSAKVIKPHPNFRIFMIADPQYGELSRAMRNRAVELFVPDFSSLKSNAYEYSASYLEVEPSMAGYLNIMNLCRVGAQSVSLDSILEKTMERLPISSISGFSRFAQQAISGLIPTDEMETFSAISKRLELWSRSYEAHQLPAGFYKQIQGKLVQFDNFSSSEPSHILTNQPLVVYGQTMSIRSDVNLMGRLQDILFRLAQMEQAFISSKSQIVQPKEATRLQRSFLTNRASNAIRESTSAVAPFLHQVQSSIIDWVKSLQTSCTDYNFFRVVAHIQTIWLNLFHLVSSTAFDEAQFRALIALGSTIVARARPVTIENTSFVETISKQFKSLGRAVQLSTGVSMEQLWRIFRPGTVPSIERLKSLLQLENMADRFDRMVWQIRAPFEEVIGLRHSIVGAIDLAYQQEVRVEPISQALEDALLTLRVDDQQDDTETRPFFRDIFECVSQVLDICMAKEPNGNHNWSSSKMNQQLHVLACRSTKYTEMKKGHPIESILSRLSDFLKPRGDHDLSTHSSSDLGAEVLRHLANIDDVTLRRLALLKFETDVLGRELAVRADRLSAGLLCSVYSILCDLVQAVLLEHKEILHPDFLAQLNGQGLQSILQKVAKCSDYGRQAIFLPNLAQDDYLKKMLEILLHPFYSAAMETGWPSYGSLSRLSDCFKSFSLVCLFLYVPDKVFDPAMRAKTERDVHEQRIKYLQEERDTYAFLENFFSGKSSSLQIKVREDDIEALGPTPSTLDIARPSRSRIDEIQIEFTNVVRLVTLLFDAWSEGQNERLEDPSLIGNVSTMIDRLSNSREEYRDITEPAVRLLKLLRIGLNLFSLSRDHSTSRSNPSSTLFQKPFLSSLPGFYIEDQFNTITLSGIPSHVLPHELRILVLKSYALRSSIQVPESWPTEIQLDFTYVISSLFVDWKRQLTAEQKRAAAKSSFYHYRGGQEEADEDQEREFENLFPTYEDQPSDSGNLPGASPQKLASVVADILTVVFLEPAKAVQQLEDMIEHSSRLIVDGQTHGSLTNEEFNPQKILSILFLQIQRKKHDLRSEAKTNSSYNAYVDRNIHETERLANFVYEVQDRFHVILQTWPEHATLHNVLSVCRELLSFRHVEPIMKFLTKAEQLHSYIAEWQSVASREYSAEPLFNKLTDLLVSWRQIELSTWAKLLELETEKCIQDARSWWFVAYENVCAIPETLEASPKEMQLHAIELIGVLETFIVGSSLGQFEQKLQILKSLLALIALSLDKNPSMRPIYNALGNFVDYFVRFVPSVRAKIAQGRQALEKQVKDVLQLASWNDRNIIALKQSAKSSHRKLFRIVRKYRDLLSQPIHELLKQDLSIPEATAQMKTNAVVLDDAFLIQADHAAKLCQRRGEYWEALPQRIRNISSTVSVMHKKTELGPDAELLHSAQRLESFVDNLETSIAQLKSETPSTLTDENASLVKYLLVRKRRLFADTMKEMRQMGLTSNPSHNLLAGQNSLGSVLSTVSRLERSDLPPDLHDAQEYLHSTVNLMSNVRQATANHHDDLSKNEVTRSIGFIESLLALNLRQRNVFAQYNTHMQAMQSTVLQVKNLWSGEDLNIQPQSTSSATDASLIGRVLMWLPTVTRLSANMLSAQAELGDLEFSEMIDELRRRADCFEDLSSAQSQIPRLPPNLLHSTNMELSENFHSAVQSLLELLSHWMESEENKPATAVLSQLVSWIQSQSQVEPPRSSRDLNVDSLEPEDFDQAVFRVIDLILGAIQDVENALSSLDRPEDRDKEWLTRCSRDLESLIKSFHIPTITQALQSILPLLYRTGISEGGYMHERLTDACASLTLVFPVVQKYYQLCREAVYRYAALHRATCRATYHLAKSFTVIASQGFCRPAEKSGEQGSSSEKLESGTGLGEGEGGEDISKDVGEDEDLSELAQDPENRKADGDIKNEDDAVDIDDALEGAAADETTAAESDAEGDSEDAEGGSDVESQDGSVGGGEGGEDDKDADAKDDEVGDVDDLGPSAVDEKLWDQAADEDKKTKEGKQSSKNVDEKDQTAAAEDTKDEPGEGPDEGEDGNEGSDVETSDTPEADPGDNEQAMDPHVKESEGFELPEELQLDGDKGRQDEIDAEDSDDQLMDDEFDADERAQDQEDSVDPDAAGEEDGPTDLERTQEDQQDEEDPSEQKNDGDEAGMDGEARPDEDNLMADQDAIEANDGSGGAMENEKPREASRNTEPEPKIQGVGPDQQTEDEKNSENAAQRQTGAQSQALNESQAQISEGVSKNQENLSRESQDTETIRKLGSMLEKWHRQQREIHESSTRDGDEQSGQQDVEMADAEFEHLPEEDARADTQALGAANDEQARSLDDSMAVAGNEKETEESAQEYPQNMDEESQDSRSDAEMEDQAPTSGNQPTNDEQDEAGAFVGDRKENFAEQQSNETASPALEEIDDELSTMQLQTLEHSPARSVSPGPSASDALALWSHHEARTHTLSMALTSHLRLILAPTLATKLRGDFRTGKRLNIKRIIPYIASSYKRDKIWMRRSVPTKRAYQVMLAIDDSKSMVENGASGAQGDAARNSSEGQTTSKVMAFDTLALVSRGLSMLDVGEISVVGFGEKVFVAHEFGSSLTSEAGGNVLRHFTFQQQRTDVKKLVQESIEIFREARSKSTGSGSAELWQLELIISDGICEDHEGIRRLLLQAREERIMIVFVIVDALVSGGGGKGQGAGKGQSIVDLERVEFVAGEEDGEGDMKVVRTKYLESFPFAYYLVVKDVKELPHVLATALRQWFAEVAER